MDDYEIEATTRSRTGEANISKPDCAITLDSSSIGAALMVGKRCELNNAGLRYGASYVSSNASFD